MSAADTRYVAALPEAARRAVADALRAAGIAGDDLEAALDGRVCDLRDTLDAEALGRVCS